MKGKNLGGETQKFFELKCTDFSAFPSFTLSLGASRCWSQQQNFMCEGPKCMEGRESFFVWVFFFKPLYHKRFLCKFSMKFIFSSMESYSMLKSKQGKQGEKDVYELRTIVLQTLMQNSSQTQESCVKMNFVERDGVTIMQRIVAFEIWLYLLWIDWNCFHSYH